MPSEFKRHQGQVMKEGGKDGGAGSSSPRKVCLKTKEKQANKTHPELGGSVHTFNQETRGKRISESSRPAWSRKRQPR